MFLIRSLIISREVFLVLFSQIEKSPEITGDFSGFRTFLRSSATFFTASDFTCHLHISCCYIFYALSQKLPEPFLIIDGPDGQINIIFTGHTDKFFCGNLFIYIHGMYSVFSAGSADFVCRLFKKKILFLFLINIRKIFLDVPEHFHISPDTGFCHRNRTDTSGIKDLLCLQSGYQGQLTNRHFQPTLF